MIESPPKERKRKGKKKGVPVNELIDAGFFSMRKDANRFFKNVEKDFDEIEERFAGIMSTFCTYEESILGVLRKMETIDEMMSLVLVAIRQNEYLQAYYPAQHGFPAGKYVGIHPAKLEGASK